MKIAPYSGRKGKLYEMFNGLNTGELRTMVNETIATDKGISIEDAKKKRTITHKQSSIVIEKLVGDLEL